MSPRAAPDFLFRYAEIFVIEGFSTRCLSLSRLITRFLSKLQTRANDLFGPNYGRPVLKQLRYELGSVHFFSFSDFVPVLCFRGAQLSSNPFPEDENAFPAVAIVAFTRCTRGPCFDRSCPPSQRANNSQKGLGAEKETRTTLEIL
jgi:hypothetical protein